MKFNTSIKNDRVKIAKEAIKIVTQYEINNGNIIIDVQHNSKYKGIDLLSKKNKKIKKIEVKGTTKEKNIPNAFASEFRNKILIADYLYLVYFNKKKYNLYIIPSKEIKTGDITEHKYYKFSSTFLNKLQKFKK